MKTDQRLWYAMGLDICKEFLEKLQIPLVLDIKSDTVGELNKAYLGGSLRRKERTIGDVDLLITTTITLDRIKQMPGVVEINSRGDKQIFLLYHSDKHNMDLSFNLWMNEDLNTFGSFMMHITGPKGYNIGLRMMAKNQGLKINQYGIFNDEVLVENSGTTEGNFYKVLKNYKYPDGKIWKEPTKR